MDCIVFWTKNPEPMLEWLEQLAAYKYYFQFTLNCRYCYANASRERVLKNSSLHDVDSLPLCGKVTEEDKVVERNVKFRN